MTAVARSTAAAEGRGRGRPPRTEAQRTAHRERLTTAAMDAIRALGADLSIDDLADHAGVSKPVLYAEFGGGKLGIADAIAEALAADFDRDVFARVARSSDVDFGTVIRFGIEGLIDLISADPAVYAFLVRSFRINDRGFLDNALVRVMHARAMLLLQASAPASATVLVDGLWGFMFAAVESWMATRQPAREELIDTLARVVYAGIETAITPL